MLPELDVRPRSAWEALDLGTLLARRHLPQLMAAWALLTVPLFLLLSLLCWRHPGLALVLFWWLKPLYERLPLYILSRALFGATPSTQQALRAFPAQLRHQWLASLTWRRLSPTRSFDLPVVQLEGLSGEARRQRLGLLGQRDSGTASWLTVVGFHLELALLLGLIALFYFLLPQQVLEDWTWYELVNDADGWLWLEHLSNSLYVLVLILWEPIYVACGFSLYLNRRTRLEGWDIELGFRQLGQRLSRLAGVLLVAGLFLMAPLGVEHSWASTTAEQPSGSQPLTGSEARERIESLLQQPPFTHQETVTRWRLRDADAADSRLSSWLEALGDTLGHAEGPAQVMKALLWSGLLGLLLSLAWRYRQWLPTFGRRRKRRRRRRSFLPASSIPDPEPPPLPEDIAATAEQLWQRDPGQALGLLYRAMLNQLEDRLALQSSLTESEVLQRVASLQQEDLSRYAEQLTRHWQAHAYGHRHPPEAAGPTLVDGYRRLFDARGPA
ncbi:DUF4129 domain-containing protein [Stutzerimonas tarimensis]|uniref:DUF4129 domain-containing protein n=1 Tax=Stutzerimonas tarimensis TaxID=1507735 RepID=A0ABV7SZH4_9GAMM